MPGAGADIVAPSAMLDGMVGGIRAALDHNAIHPRSGAPRIRQEFAVRVLRTFPREAGGGAPCQAGGPASHTNSDIAADGRRPCGSLPSIMDEGADLLMAQVSPLSPTSM